jgi:cold shock protein
MVALEQELTGTLQPCSRRIRWLCFCNNRILAIRPVLSCGHDRFGLPPKSALWRDAQRNVQPLCPRLRWHKDRLRRQTMQNGTVKWFNSTKGYGFITPSSGDKDVFVHISAVERAGLRTLNEGQVVEYELVTNRGRTSAENLKVA